MTKWGDLTAEEGAVVRKHVILEDGSSAFVIRSPLPSITGVSEAEFYTRYSYHRWHKPRLNTKDADATTLRELLAERKAREAAGSRECG